MSDLRPDVDSQGQSNTNFDDDLNMPIAASRKAKKMFQSLNQWHISYDKLSPKLFAFIKNLSNIKLLKTIQDVLKN